MGLECCAAHGVDAFDLFLSYRVVDEGTEERMAILGKARGMIAVLSANVIADN